MAKESGGPILDRGAAGNSQRGTESLSPPFKLSLWLGTRFFGGFSFFRRERCAHEPTTNSFFVTMRASRLLGPDGVQRFHGRGEGGLVGARISPNAQTGDDRNMVFCFSSGVFPYP